jgi:hypothetical protein
LHTDRKAPDERARSRDKDARFERAIVHALKAGGFAAERVPLSGAAGGRYSGDIVLPLMGPPIEMGCGFNALTALGSGNHS